MKRKIQILFIIVITIACILLGINAREKNAILVTQIGTNSQETLSYLLQTKENNLIMIDGGSREDAEHLEQVLMEKGGKVNAWFITIAHEENFGALAKIIENEQIQIENIYVSFNTAEWYEEYEPDRYLAILEFLDLIYSGDMKDKFHELPNKYEVLIDNLYVTALNLKNPDLNGDYAGFNQSMVLKVNNTYKSMIFMGNIANEAATKFKDNNLDEIDCDAVQVSNNGMQYVNNEIYQKMTPKYLFMPASKDSDKQYLQNLKSELGAEEIYASDEGDVSIKIK